MASGTSKEMELKLTNVARASLEELLEDYRDFLRSKGAEEWHTEHPYAQRLRMLNRIPGATFETFRKGIEHPDPAVCTNVIIGLIRVTSYLLDHQIKQLERGFEREGGLRERMTQARWASRNKSDCNRRKRMFEMQYNEEMEAEVKRLEAKKRATEAGHPEWENACDSCGCRITGINDRLCATCNKAP